MDKNNQMMQVVTQRASTAVSGVVDRVAQVIVKHNERMSLLLDEMKMARGDLTKILRGTLLQYKRPDVPEIDNIPADLKDSHLHLIHDAQGKRMVDSLLLSDFLGYGKTTASPLFPILRAQLFPFYLMMIPLVYLVVWIPVVGTFAAFITVWLVPKIIAVKRNMSVRWFALSLWTRLKNDSINESGGDYAERRYASMSREGSGLFSMAAIPGYIVKLVKISIGVAAIAILLAKPVLCAIILPIYIILKINSDIYRNMSEMEDGDREGALQRQGQHFVRSSIATDMALMDQATVQAKRDQAEQAIKDDTPILDINLIASGFMTRAGDIDAPDAGKSMVLSLADLAPGMIMYGEPGTGKTAGIFRPLADELFRKTDCGALVCDTKGTLQTEFKERYGDDFRLVSPVEGGDIIAPIQGLDAHMAAQFIADAMSGDQSTGEQIWPDAAKRDIFNRALILQEAKRLGVAGIKWTVNSLIGLMGNQSKSVQLVGDVVRILNEKGGDGVSPYLLQAVEYITVEFQKMTEQGNTAASITFTAQSWATKITMHPEIFRWMDCEEGVVVEDVCNGLRIGVYVPVAQYGEAGMVVEKILRYRVYNAIMNRPDNWRELGQKPVALMWDEMAAGIGQGVREADMMPMCRSRGLSIVAATQTLTELEARMGRERAHALVALFPNIIAYRSDANTMNHLSANLGVIRKLSRMYLPEDVPVTIDYYGAMEAIHQSRTGATTVYDGEFLQKIRDLRIHNAGISTKEKHSSAEMISLPTELDYPEGEKLCLRVLPRWEPEKYGYFVNNNMYAVVRLKRAGRYRYDLAYSTPIFTSAIFTPKMDEKAIADYVVGPMVKKIINQN